MRSLFTLFIALFLTAFSVGAQRENGAIVRDITDCGSPSPTATGKVKGYAYFISFDKPNHCYNVLIVITSDAWPNGGHVIGTGQTCIPEVVRTADPSTLPAGLRAVMNECSFQRISNAVVDELSPLITKKKSPNKNVLIKR